MTDWYSHEFRYLLGENNYKPCGDRNQWGALPCLRGAGYNLAVTNSRDRYRSCVFLRRAAMPQGKIKRLVSDRGFGFVEGERDDLFFHHSEVQGVSFEEL